MLSNGGEGVRGRLLEDGLKISQHGPAYKLPLTSNWALSDADPHTWNALPTDICFAPSGHF